MFAGTGVSVPHSYVVVELCTHRIWQTQIPTKYPKSTSEAGLAPCYSRVSAALLSLQRIDQQPHLRCDADPFRRVLLLVVVGAGVVDQDVQRPLLRVPGGREAPHAVQRREVERRADAHIRMLVLIPGEHAS